MCPPYQRDYSWTEEQWEDLWKDIIGLRDQTEESHYMGALVVKATSDRDFQIIDGQQRMATLSLLALAVISRLRRIAAEGVHPRENEERAEALRHRFIGEKDPASLVESSKLFLNRSDDDFYQAYLVQIRPPRNPLGLPRSNKLLWECFQYFERELEDDETLASNGEALARLLAETVGRQLLFILISVDDELKAYTVFETLNARGLELSATDLLKNYLFSVIRVDADLEALQRQWREHIGAVRQERFPEFLRYHLQTIHPKVRSSRLFKLVRDSVRTPDQVFALMDALGNRAELFAALLEPNHGYWIDNPRARPYIRDLGLFRVRQMTPLLFAAWERLSAPDFTRVLRLVCVISFQYTVVSGLNPNTLEGIYHLAARSVLDGSARTPAEVFDYLRPIYVDDEKFYQDFVRFTIETSGQRKRLAKYVLTRLETDASGHAYDPDTDPGTIEHILPEHPSEAWETRFPRQRWDSAVYRVGNLTLLEAGANRQIGNADYAEKARFYGASGYALTRAIPELAPEDWTPELLDERQRRLAARAVHLWQADFS